MDKKNILIITPPVISPALPAFTAAFAAGCFLHAGVNTVQYDANLDFFVCHLSSPDFFRSASFYDPEKYLMLGNRIDPFYPLGIKKGYLPDRSDKTRWNQSFISFCQENLDSKLKQVHPVRVILMIDCEGQVQAANTIIGYIKTAFPKMETIALKGSQYTGKHHPAADHVFSLLNPLLFFQWINNTWKRNCRYINIEPDYSVFPLKEYLAPELILPLNTSFFKGVYPFPDLVSKLRAQYNAKGFLFENFLPSFRIFKRKNINHDLIFGVRAVIDDVGRTFSDNERQVLFFSGVRLIQWEVRTNKHLEMKTLWALSRQGIWNHVDLASLPPGPEENELLTDIALNPNIVHSFEKLNVKDPCKGLSSYKIDESLQPYSKVNPLPGEPFWKVLSDPVHLLLYLKQYGKKKLFSLRADRSAKRIISLGSHICFYFKKPDELSPDDFDEICKMVEAGGSVDTKYVRHNLERAYLIGFAMEHGVIVGNSSLKHPRKQFVLRLNTATGLDFNNFVERGYTSVRPEYRAMGLGAGLLDGLTKRAGHYRIFSIISEDNIATHKIAIKNKTKKIAVYYSEKLGKKLGVWVPEDMIDKEWMSKL